MDIIVTCVIGLTAFGLWALRTQLRARDATAATRNPELLRALSRSELQLVAVGAWNDTGPGRGIGAWATMETTREQREQCRILYGLGRTLHASAKGMGLEVVCDPKALGRYGAMVLGDKLIYRPGMEREAMIEMCAAALRRADIHFTRDDAIALAAELVAKSNDDRNIAQQKSGQRNI